MTIKFVTNDKIEITTVKELVSILEASEKVIILDNDVVIKEIKFGKGQESKLTYTPHIIIHGMFIPKNLETIIEWINGDDHDRSKIQFLSPRHSMKSFF